MQRNISKKMHPCETSKRKSHSGETADRMVVEHKKAKGMVQKQLKANRITVEHVKKTSCSFPIRPEIKKVSTHTPRIQRGQLTESETRARLTKAHKFAHTCVARDSSAPDISEYAIAQRSRTIASDISSMISSLACSCRASIRPRIAACVN